MDRERLTDLLRHPALATQQDLAPLRSMAERFPWFSGAHLLLAVSQHRSGDVLANDRYANPAAHIPSRAVLYDLVHQEVPLPPATAPIAPPNPPSASTSQQETSVHSQPPLALPIAALVKSEEASNAEPLAAPVPEEIARQEQPEVESKQMASPTPDAPPHPTPGRNTDVDVLDLQINEAIQASGYHLGDYLAAASPATHIPPPPPRTGLADTPLAPKTPPDVVAPVEPVLVQPQGRRTFTDWLGHQTQPDAPPAGLEQKTTPPPSFAPATSPKTVATPDAAQILEQFIQHASPAPSKPKATFFQPQQAAKKSLEDQGLVSETLARILEKQGNFTKAREVYDRLALKHPEKSIYFAALSKALEGQSNK